MSEQERSRRTGDKLPEHEGGRGVPERGPGSEHDRETGRRGGEMPEHEGGKGVPERGRDRRGPGSGRGTDPGREVGRRERKGRNR